jgi:hypothetical protein
MVFPVFLPPKVDLVIRIYLIYLKPPDRFAMIFDLCRMILTEFLICSVSPVPLPRPGDFVDPDPDIADGQRGDSDPGYRLPHFTSPSPDIP